MLTCVSVGIGKTYKITILNKMKSGEFSPLGGEEGKQREQLLLCKSLSVGLVVGGPSQLLIGYRI